MIEYEGMSSDELHEKAEQKMYVNGWTYEKALLQVIEEEKRKNYNKDHDKIKTYSESLPDVRDRKAREVTQENELWDSLEKIKDSEARLEVFSKMHSMGVDAVEASRVVTYCKNDVNSILDYLDKPKTKTTKTTVKRY